jgi:hypothetical protein
MSLSLFIWKALCPHFETLTLSKCFALQFKRAGFIAFREINSFILLFLLTIGLHWPLAVQAQAQAPSPEAPSTEAPGLVTIPSNPIGKTPSSSSENTPSDKVQSSKAPVSNATSSTAYPKWSDLNAKQKLALLPLVDLWPKMSETQKRKWLSLSANFSELTASDQEKLQARMTQWSLLSPQQRAQARVIFAQVQQFQGDERLNKWQEYQALDPAKKNELAQNLNIMPNSAAISPKPKAVGSNNTTLYKPATELSHIRLQVDQIASQTLLPPKRSSPAP